MTHKRSAGTEDYAAKCERVTEELRTVVREGRELLSDLRRMKLEIDESLDKRVDQVTLEFSSTVTEVVKAHVDEMTKVFKAVSEDSVARVMKKFDTISGILMGEVRTDEEDMVTLTRRVRAAMDRTLPEADPAHIPAALRRPQ